MQGQEKKSTINDNISCPVTLEIFREPRVLECGHTFEAYVLHELKTKECPVCRKPYYTTPPINWALVDIMGLDLSHLKKKTPMCSFAKEMQRTSDRVVDALVIKNRILLLKRITDASKKGKYEYRFGTNDLHMPFWSPDETRQTVLIRLYNQLAQMGFSVLRKSRYTQCFSCSPTVYLKIWWVNRG